LQRVYLSPANSYAATLSSCLQSQDYSDPETCLPYLSFVQDFQVYPYENS
jgi:hypothetical protein